MILYYYLDKDGKTPIGADNVGKWMKHNKQSRTVEMTPTPNGYVSTVFLGIDHGYGMGKPILWETMIFGGPHNQEQDRYMSYDAAVAGHWAAVERAGGVVSNCFLTVTL